MIVWKDWEGKQPRIPERLKSNTRHCAYYWEGWFLFGIIPLYIRRHFRG